MLRAIEDAVEVEVMEEVGKEAEAVERGRLAAYWLKTLRTSGCWSCCATAPLAGAAAVTELRDVVVTELLAVARPAGGQRVEAVAATSAIAYKGQSRQRQRPGAAMVTGRRQAGHRP